MVGVNRIPLHHQVLSLESNPLDIVRISLIRFSQIQVMSTTSNGEHWKVGINILLDAADGPWVEVSIGENDVVVVLVVISVVLTTKLREGPSVVWSKTELVFARLSVSSFVPVLLDKHAISTSLIDGHSQLVAGKNIPTSGVKSTRSILLGHVIAEARSFLVVEVDIGDDLKLVKFLLISLAGDGSIPISVSGLTSSLDWVGWNRVQEGSGVRVIDHGQVFQARLESLKGRHDLIARVNWSASVESVFDHALESSVILLVGKELEGILIVDFAPAIFVGILEYTRDQVIKSFRSDSSILEVDGGSRGSVGTLNDVGVLHSHPSGKHTTIRASKHNSGTLVGLWVVRPQVGDEVSVILQSLLNGQPFVISCGESSIFGEWE